MNSKAPANAALCSGLCFVVKWSCSTIVLCPEILGWRSAVCRICNQEVVGSFDSCG